MITDETKTQRAVHSRRPWLFGFGLVLLLATPAAAQPLDQRKATVGMTARIEQLLLPGGELLVKPLESDATPIVMRITGVFPHGTQGHRYDIVYYGLEPGDFNLSDYLEYKDESPTDGLPEIKVSIERVLPPGQVMPNSLKSETAPYLGGYRMWWVLGATVWFLGLLLILFAGRGRGVFGGAADAAPKTLAERLRPTVEEAMRGEATHDRLAQLERLLVAFWRRRLKLESATAAKAIVALREHDEAGALLRQLELWLHRPGGSDQVDVAELLAPYKDLPPDALEADDDE